MHIMLDDSLLVLFKKKEPTKMSDSSQGKSEPAAAPAEILTELNVEARTVLGFNALEEALKTQLPAGWTPNPAETGPLKGANLLIIFSDRLLVQSSDGQPLPGQAANQITVVAVPAQNAETKARGVMIIFGLSARPEGAPGPYNVFLPAAAYVERILSSGPGDAREAAEQWSFTSEGGDRLKLRMRYSRGVPVRSMDALTQAFSGKDPTFYRIYHADQGADVLRSAVTGSDAISDLEFGIEGNRLGALFDGSERLVSVISQPWTVRHVFLPQHAQEHFIKQEPDAAAYTKPYVVRRPTMWVDSPSQSNENGWLQKDQKLWLAEDLGEGAQGMRLAKLEDGKIRYITEAANLAKEAGSPVTPGYDEEKIRQIINDLGAAWNKGDAKAWVKNYAEDSDVINMLGVTLVGPQANQERHAALFAGIFKDSTLKTTIRRIRFIGGNMVAVVDTDLVLTGFSGLPPGIEAHPDGSLRMTMRHVLENDKGSWSILASQNTAVMPPRAPA
jgi:uncharacterized protein (TIGR02246 family)